MKISKFLFSTLVAAAAMTSTAFAEGTTLYVDVDNTFSKAVEELTPTISEIKILENVGEVLQGDLELIAKGNLSITADEKTTVSLSNNGTSYDLIIGGTDGNQIIAIEENVTLEVADRVIWAGYYDNNGSLHVDGTLKGSQLWMGLDTTVSASGKLISSGEAMVFRRGATLDVQGGTVDANYFNFLSGNLMAKDATITGGLIGINNTGGYAREGSVQICLDNTTWTSSGNLKTSTSETGALIEVDNGSILTVGLHDGFEESLIDKNSNLWVSNKSTLNTDKIKIDGCVDLYDATWNATGVISNNGTIDVREKSTLNATSLSNSGYVRIQDDSTLNVSGTIDNVGGVLEVYNSTLQNQKITGSDGAYIYAEGATFENVNVSGQETYTVNTDFNGGNYTGKVYTGYGIVDGKWAKIKDSESTITGTVDASTVYWQNYGKLTIEKGAELKTDYFSEGSTQVLTVNGTISAGTFRGYNGIVSETGKINAQAAVQFYGNPDVQRQYDVAGEIVVTHDIAYAHNVVIGFNTAKQWYGDGPNDYWNIGGANTVVNISGEKAKLQIVAGKAGKGTAIIHVDEEGTKATLNITNGAEFVVDGKVINNGNLNIADGSTLSVTGDIENAGNLTIGVDTVVNVGGKVTVKVGGKLTLAASSLLENLTVANEGGEVVVQTIDAAVTTQALTVESIDGSNVNLSAGADIVVHSATKIENTSDIIVSATDVVLAAWSFDIDNESNDVTVTMDVGTLSESDQANLKILHKADGTSDWTVTDIKGEYKDGKVTFTTNSFSSYAVAIPEPSAFGLLAGLGAIALAVSRRRRSC